LIQRIGNRAGGSLIPERIGQGFQGRLDLLRADRLGLLLEGRRV
jgi:hypothetical protein